MILRCFWPCTPPTPTRLPCVALCGVVVCCGEWKRLVYLLFCALSAPWAFVTLVPPPHTRMCPAPWRPYCSGLYRTCFFDISDFFKKIFIYLLYRTTAAPEIFIYYADMLLGEEYCSVLKPKRTNRFVVSCCCFEMF